MAEGTGIEPARDCSHLGFQPSAAASHRLALPKKKALPALARRAFFETLPCISIFQ